MARKTPPGVTVKHSGSPNAHWYIDKKINNKRYQKSSGRFRRDYLSEGDWWKANEEWYAFWRESLRRIEEYGERPKRSFLEGCQAYLEHNKGTIRSIEEVTRLLSIACSYVGAEQLRTVDQSHPGIVKLTGDLRKAGNKNQTINNQLTAVRAVLNFCAEYKGGDNVTWLDRAPKFKLLPRTDQRHPRVLLWEEQTSLLSALPSHLALMSEFILNTGLRSSEACNLRKAQMERVSGVGSVLIVERAKNHQKFPVVLNSAAERIFEVCSKQSSGEYVFTFKEAPIERINNTGWKKAVKRLKLDVRVHDLRHTFSHRLLEIGCPEEVRRVMLGHKAGSMTQHYSQTSLETMLEYAEKITKKRKESTPYLRVV